VDGELVWEERSTMLRRGGGSADAPNGGNKGEGAVAPSASATSADRAGGAGETISAAPPAESSGWAGSDRPARSSAGPEQLEHRIAQLEREVAELRAELSALRDELGA